MVVGQAKKKGVRSSKKTAESSASGGETSAETSDSDWIRTNDLPAGRRMRYINKSLGEENLMVVG
jgi:hypothetical protein